MEVQGVRQEAVGLPRQRSPWPIPGAVQACGLQGELPPKSSPVWNCSHVSGASTCCNKWNGIDRRGSGTQREALTDRQPGRSTRCFWGKSTLFSGQICWLSWEELARPSPWPSPMCSEGIPNGRLRAGKNADGVAAPCGPVCPGNRALTLPHMHRPLTGTDGQAKRPAEH